MFCWYLPWCCEYKIWHDICYFMVFILFLYLVTIIFQRTLNLPWTHDIRRNTGIISIFLAWMCDFKSNLMDHCFNSCICKILTIIASQHKPLISSSGIYQLHINMQYYQVGQYPSLPIIPQNEYNFQAQHSNTSSLQLWIA